ncbi:hypothetical protein PSYRMG_22135 [Pseudomonas syringae UMAF0158]|jgi:hypothetical protein|nr:hypothetical protein PSYRMG_22135 [Pseudomonas syringae UMAF0158]
MRKWLTGSQIDNDQTRAVVDGVLQHGRALSEAKGEKGILASLLLV